jgi:hypothetical protein
VLWIKSKNRRQVVPLDWESLVERGHGGGWTKMHGKGVAGDVAQNPTPPLSPPPPPPPSPPRPPGLATYYLRILSWKDTS